MIILLRKVNNYLRIAIFLWSISIGDLALIGITRDRFPKGAPKEQAGIPRAYCHLTNIRKPVKEVNTGYESTTNATIKNPYLGI